MSVYDVIRAANAGHIADCRGDYAEYMEELERKRIANEEAMQGSPIIAAFRARRRAQATQFKSALSRILSNPKA